MAKLFSSDGHDAIRLCPNFVDAEKEGWVYSKLLFMRREIVFFETTGNFLQIKEYRQFIEDIQRLAKGQDIKITMDPIEPNFNLSIFKSEKSDAELQVVCSYCENINYKEGIVIKDNAKTKIIEFVTDRGRLISFSKQLSEEVAMIKK